MLPTPRALHTRMSEHYQIITLQLVDGRKIDAMVKAFCTEDEIPTLRVHEISISIPKEMPSGCHWGPMGDDKDQTGG